MIELEQIYKMIEIDQPRKVKSVGMALARNVEQLGSFIMPKIADVSQNIWYSCAEILVDKSDEEIFPFLENLFDWICKFNLEKNKYGADIIFHRLMEYKNREELKKALNGYFQRVENKDKMRILKELLCDNKELFDDYPIEKILEMLDWNQPIHIQSKGRIIAKQVNDIINFILPSGERDKYKWENCARIVSERSDAELKPYLKECMEWFQDLCWPGSIIMFERMKRYENHSEIIEALSFCLNIAIATEDEGWIYGLEELKEEIEQENCLEIEKIDIDIILQLLDESGSQEKQEKGKELARQRDITLAFIHPLPKEKYMNAWENCAEIVCERTDGELLFYLPELFQWIRNPQNPGGERISERLRKWNKDETFFQLLQQEIESAKKVGDYPYAERLAYWEVN